MEEVEAAIRHVHYVLAVDVAQGIAPRTDIIAGAAEDLDSLIEPLAPLQALGDIGIAGLGHVARRPFAGDIDRVGITPGHALLAIRQLEAARDEALGGNVKLA